MGVTACFLIEPGALESLDAEPLWDLWRLLTVRGFSSVSDTTWSAGAGDDLALTLTRRRELPTGVDRPRYDELRLRTTSVLRGAAWRFVHRDLPAVGRLVGARMIWVLDDAALEDQAAQMTVHRSLRSGELAPFQPSLLAVPTGSVLAGELERRGPVTHDSGFSVLRT